MKMTQAQFTRTLASIKKSGQTLAGNIQKCIVYAFEHYAKNGNTVFMAQVVEACNAGKSIAAKHVVGYIEEHANVRFSTIVNKNGNNQDVFRKVTTDKAPKVKKLTQSVFDWKRSNVEAKPLDAAMLLSGTNRRLDKAIEADNCKNKKQAVKIRGKLLEIQAA